MGQDALLLLPERLGEGRPRYILGRAWWWGEHHAKRACPHRGAEQSDGGGGDGPEGGEWREEPGARGAL